MSDLPGLVDSQLSLHEGIALLKFNRHDVRNELTGTAIAREIVAVCEWANRNSQVGVLVLTGNGTAFSAGGNIHDMHQRKGMFGGTPSEIQNDYRRGIQRMAIAMNSLEVPVIAAVNGAAIGAGFDLACMCDIRLGSVHAKMGETFVNLGIIPGDGGAWFLPRVVGAQRAAELTFSGRIVEADEAQAIGLLLGVYSADELLPSALQMAEGFAKKPREALRIAKRIMRSGQRMNLPDFLDYCASLQSICHTTLEHAEAVRTMVDKVR
ncbi:enoyl-CoA hydratase-related protein [Erythrobacter aurantius]|uniref:enoyl-CoA hydratase-related protein n=1 Tax=Erythrobacter aurantius TaxID=2909249 RepID=UPI0020794ECB|nr:enoyl-CoA hydratase-related protein [Erythrobacter aurantius]